MDSRSFCCDYQIVDFGAEIIVVAKRLDEFSKMGKTQVQSAENKENIGIMYHTTGKE